MKAQPNYPITIEARLTSLCLACGTAVLPGCHVTKQDRNAPWIHKTCAEQPPSPPKRTDRRPVLINSYFDAKPSPTKTSRFRTRNRDVFPRTP